MADVDTRIALDLHPDIVTNLVGYDDDDARPVLTQAEGVLQRAWDAIRSIHDAKAAAATDPTLNESAQLLKVDDFATARMEPITTAWDSAVKTLEANIVNFEKEMDAPVVSKASQMVSGEVRLHFKNLPTGERVGAVQNAIAAGDETTVSSVLGAPGFLSGISEDMVASFKRAWAERTMPVVFKRHRSAVAALDMLNAKGGLLLKEWIKAVGVIEVRQQVRGGPPVVQNITPQQIRAKRDAAHKAFAQIA